MKSGDYTKRPPLAISSAMSESTETLGATTATVAVIGGTGFYAVPGMGEALTIELDTPFGPPSAPIKVGVFGGSGGRRVAFLPRHGAEHTLLPSEVNSRANIFALKQLGVRQVFAVSAVGSLRAAIAPGDWVVPRQIIDRTVGRPATFFGNGVVAHVSLAEPVCPRLAAVLHQAAAPERDAHGDKVYLCLEGPQFSTRAESLLWRAWGADIVGMTCQPEARLAREAELCYAILALPTDYDSWRDHGTTVTARHVQESQRAHVAAAQQLLAQALRDLPDPARCPCQRSLDNALLTDPRHIDAAAVSRLRPLLGRVLAERSEPGQTMI